MSEQPDTAPEPEGDGGYGEHEAGRVRSLDDLHDKVDRIFSKLFGDGEKAAEKTEAEPRSIAAEVRAELAKLKRAEAKQKDDDARAAEVEELKKKVAAQEKPPKEYRRITSRLWGGDE